MSATATAIIPRYRLKESRINRAEFGNTVWSIDVDANTPFEEVLKPEYWANVAGPRKLKIGDKIDVYPEEWHYFATLLVRDVGALWAKVEKLEKYEFETLAQDDGASDDFRIEFKAPRTTKWCVVRASDNHLVQTGMASRHDAQIWLTNYRKALAA
ncbi:MAG: hypothetical protein H0U59_08470 [Gemmatimonadaceae bacterium]|nr:hypothetical protein [Gemmatimonadaceae bacterium]